jgi:hypothetical protein
MDDLHRLEARGLARARARSRRRRASIIRSRTVRGSLGLFAIPWAIIFLQPERQLEAELAAEREAEWETEPVVPVITCAS